MWPVPMKGAGHGPISTHRYYSGLEWSPDGRRLAFAAQELKDPEDPFLWKDWYRTEGFGDIRRRVQIWTVEAEGGTPVQITSGDYHHGQPSWSPDGRHLVFMANRGGREEEILWSMNEDYDVWLVPVTGGTPRELTSNIGPDINPVWSSDGGSIAFSSGWSSGQSRRRLPPEDDRCRHERSNRPHRPSIVRLQREPRAWGPGWMATSFSRPAFVPPVMCFESTPAVGSQPR